MKLYGQVKGIRRTDVQPLVEPKPVEAFTPPSQREADKRYRDRKMSEKLPEGMKMCSNCLKPRPIEDFDHHKNGRQYKMCNGCRAKRKAERERAALKRLEQQDALGHRKHQNHA